MKDFWICTLVFLIICIAIAFSGCKLDCSNLPIEQKPQVLVLPVRVEPTPDPDACKDERELIEALQDRLNFENCNREGW